MRSIFNNLSDPFGFSTRALCREVGRTPWHWYPGNYTSTPEMDGDLPSVETVQSLIAKGANVNAKSKALNGFTVLDACILKYQSCMEVSAKPVPTPTVTAEEWKGYANRYLEVGKLLISAGADPRNTYGLKCLLQETRDGDSFRSLVTQTVTALNKRDATKASKEGPTLK